MQLHWVSITELRKWNDVRTVQYKSTMKALVLHQIYVAEYIRQTKPTRLEVPRIILSAFQWTEDHHRQMIHIAQVDGSTHSSDSSSQNPYTRN